MSPGLRLFVALIGPFAVWAAGCHDVGAISTPPVTEDAATPDDAEGGIDSPLETTDASVDDAESSTLADDAPRGDVIAVLNERDSTCGECALASCSNYVHACDQIAGLASEGPGAGTPRSLLCSETLTCFFETGCAKVDQTTCFCGPHKVTGLFEDCIKYPETDTGPCKSVLERSLETTSASVILASFTNVSRAGGWATLLYRCLLDNHCASCFEHPDGGDGGGDL